MTTPICITLNTLSDTGMTVADPAQDIRGRKVKDENGRSLGKVRDLLIDDAERKVPFLLVEHGGLLGQEKSVIPVNAINRITKDAVFLNHTREHVAAAPGYDPALINERTYHDSIYNHYGYLPYWRTVTATRHASSPAPQPSQISRGRARPLEVA